MNTNKLKFYGMLESSFRFIERNQIHDVNLWEKFVNQFRLNADDDFGWRCEYWGKTMRGASMIVKYTHDDGFYRILENSVRDILTTQDKAGRIATYSPEKEFNAWDLWGRKYVMLGMEYFLEICRDNSLAEKITESLCLQADYIINHIGSEDGKTEICKATGNWEGLNSCSILEPVIRLYRLTNNEKYLKFGEYIISTGFIESNNLIELAYKNEIPIHEYPVVKAYEMMSCFEGHYHYYKINPNEKHKTALINYGRSIIDDEISVISCSGCTHELFDHTAVNQTQTDYDGVVQETCVTVTWMRFANELLELTGDTAFADAVEQSFYNCYLGSFNTYRVPFCRYPRMNDVPQIMPFDSYSPLTANQRGLETGGYQLFSDSSFYGCCACIGGAGSGMMPDFAYSKSKSGIIINFYEQAQINTQTPNGNNLSLTVKSTYPLSGKVEITLNTSECEEFEISLRIPKWCKTATITFGAETKAFSSGYAVLKRRWQTGDTILLDMPMRVERILPPPNAVNADIFAAYRRGPMLLCADARITDPHSAINILCDENAYAECQIVPCSEIPDAEICVKLKTSQGKEVRLINYSSSGKTWSKESECAVWLYRK